MSADIVAERAANALIEDAQGKITLGWPAHGEIERTRARYGGLWVGGRVVLTAGSVVFRPNGVNRGLNAGSLDVEVPVSDIVSVVVRPALVTQIIEVRTAHSVLKVRCFRARAFADQIRRAMPRADSPTASGTAEVSDSG